MNTTIPVNGSSAQPVGGVEVGRVNIGKVAGDKSSEFRSILQEKTGLRFSNHVIDRMEDRALKLNNETVERLSRAVEIADRKGADQSLVLLDQLAFLVSVKNKTVITAVETNQMKQGVFTRIDSAIIG